MPPNLPAMYLFLMESLSVAYLSSPALFTLMMVKLIATSGLFPRSSSSSQN